MANESTRQVALITGASAGIGEGFARRLAQDNYNLVLVARRHERLEALSEELRDACGTSTEVITADLATDEGVKSIEARLSRGDIDLLINNAGFGTFGAFAKLPIERELQELDLNVRALMRLSHAGLSAMSDRGRGGIINVASAAGFQPIPYNATYSATKAFVLHFTEALHEEAKENGVRVTCLCPGPVKTEFQEVSGVDASAMPSFAWVTVETVVDDALGALRAGRAISLPGAINAITANSVRFAPRFLVRRISGAMFKNSGFGG
jgi:hypothetical protein